MVGNVEMWRHQDNHKMKIGGEGLRIVADNSGRKALFGFKETQAARAATLQVVETKQSNSGSYHTLYEQVGAGGLTPFPPLALPNIAIWVEI